MIYRVGRVLLSFAVRQFFSEIRVIGQPVPQGPVLFAVNHPNHMLDPFLVLSVLQRPLWFLAKSTLFRPAAVGKLLAWCHLLPVYRQQDEGDTRKNSDIFESVVRILRCGGGVVIFPEGTSLGVRGLLPLKTGAARIALQAVEAEDSPLPMQIQPVGITYAELTRFRSSVTLNFATPLQVARYQAQFREDPVRAVRALTAELEQRMREATVHLEERAYDQLVEKIGVLYRARGDTFDDFARLSVVAQHVVALAPHHPEQAAGIERKLDQWFDHMRAIGLDPTEFARHEPLPLLLVPLLAFGVLIHYPPYLAVQRRSARYLHDPVLVASSKFATGLLLFPSWYVLLSGVVGVLVGWWWLPVTFILLTILGLATNHWLAPLRWRLLMTQRASAATAAARMRDELIAELEALRGDNHHET